MAGAPVDRYDFSHERRGTAIIFNIVDFGSGPMAKREGSDVDMMILQKAFGHLGFDPESDIFTYRNVTTTKMISALLDSVGKDDHVNSDCFICAILTHGDQDQVVDDVEGRMIGDVVHGSDGPVALRDLIKIVTDCPGLAGKPKIFLVQACRGQFFSDALEVEISEQEKHSSSKGVPRRDASDHARANSLAKDEQDAIGELPKSEGVAFYSENDIQLIKQMPVLPPPVDTPVFGDCLLVYATQPGFFAFRNRKTGSPLINHFGNHVQKHGKEMDFLRLLTRVTHDVAYTFTSSTQDPVINGKKMMPWISSRLTKDIFF